MSDWSAHENISNCPRVKRLNFALCGGGQARVCQMNGIRHPSLEVLRGRDSVRVS